MLKEQLELIKYSFQSFNGTGGMYFAIFLISILYLFLTEKEKDKRCSLVYISILALFVILNPIIAIFLSKVFGRVEYVRLFWILPMGIVISYSITKVIAQIKEKKTKIIVAIFSIFIIIVSGKCVYHPDYYSKVKNYYKVPDEAIQVTDYILADNTEVKKVMLPVDLVPCIRQINAKIQLYYGRKSNENYNNVEIVQQLNNGNVEYVATTCKKDNYNYIIFNRSTPLNGNMNDYGYKILAQTENYDIYVLQNDNIQE